MWVVVVAAWGRCEGMVWCGVMALESDLKTFIRGMGGERSTARDFVKHIEDLDDELDVR